jgi:large subunit ribosomal protein L15
MKLNELKPSTGAFKSPKRVGRGYASGIGGHTSSRGHKGQKSRSGGKVRPGFEGGQMPLVRRIPKKGFTNFNHKEFNILNLSDLDRLFKENEEVSMEVLLKRGIIKSIKSGIKILGNGEITKPLTLRVNAISKSAKEKVENIGGKVEVI